jgi:hypothetical protein
MNLSETMKLLDVPKATSISCDSGFRGDVRLSYVDRLLFRLRDFLSKIMLCVCFM